MRRPLATIKPFFCSMNIYHSRMLRIGKQGITRLSWVKGLQNRESSKKEFLAISWAIEFQIPILLTWQKE